MRYQAGGVRRGRVKKGRTKEISGKDGGEPKKGVKERQLYGYLALGRRFLKKLCLGGVFSNNYLILRSRFTAPAQTPETLRTRTPFPPLPSDALV